MFDSPPSTSRHFFVLEDDTGKNAIGPNCFHDTRLFFSEFSRDVFCTPLSTWENNISDAFGGAFPSGSVFVVPGGNALQIKQHLITAGAMPDTLAYLRRNILENRQQYIGICAGGALGAASLTVHFADQAAWEPSEMMHLSDISAKAPLTKGGHMHSIQTERATTTQLGLHNVGFGALPVGSADQVVATYAAPKDPGHYAGFTGAAVQNEHALLFGYHPEAATMGAKLPTVSGCEWTDEPTRTAALAQSTEIIQRFLSAPATK